MRSFEVRSLNIAKFLRRTYYIRIGADRLRIDEVGGTPVFDDLAVVAIRTDSRGRKLIAAVGRAAEKLAGATDIQVVRPFANPRTVLDDFTVASKLMQHGVRQLVLAQGWSAMKPLARVLLHPLRRFEGGLTQVELRSLRELAESCGARLTAVYEGRELTMDEVEAFKFDGTGRA